MRRGAAVKGDRESLFCPTGDKIKNRTKTSRGRLPRLTVAMIIFQAKLYIFKAGLLLIQ